MRKKIFLAIVILVTLILIAVVMTYLFFLLPKKEIRRPIYFQVVVDVNYFYEFEEMDKNCQNLRKHLDLMKKYKIKGDYYFTWLAARSINDFDPDLITRFKKETTSINQHGANIGPAPTPIDRVSERDWEEDVKTITDYESHDLSAYGRLVRIKEGGMKGLKNIFKVTPLSTGRFFSAPILKVEKDFGVKMCAGLKDDDGADSNQAWYMGVLNRPENIFIDPNKRFVPWAIGGKGDLIKDLNNEVSLLDRNNFNLIVFDISDNDITRIKSPKDEKKFWDGYEKVIQWAVNNKEIKMVTLRDIWNMAVDDRTKVLKKNEIIECARNIKGAVEDRKSLLTYISLGSNYLSLTDSFQVLAGALDYYDKKKKLPDSISTKDLLGPTELFTSETIRRTVDGAQVVGSAKKVYARLKDRIPTRVDLERKEINAAEFLFLMAQEIVMIDKYGTLKGVFLESLGILPPQVEINQKARDLTKLQFWTYKPARWKMK